MAVKASTTVTITEYRDTLSVTRYYKLVSATASAPSKPTANPPDGWTDTEPSYTSNSTEILYFCDLTVFSNGEWEYSKVSKSSSYEAAKEASTMASEYLTPIEGTDDSGPKLQIHYSPDSITRTEITNHSYDVHIEDDDRKDVLAASFGIPQSFVKGEHSEFNFRDNGIGIKDNDGYDYFQVYKTPGGEPANEEKLLGDVATNTPVQYLIKHDYESFTKIYLEDDNDRYYLYSDGTICIGGPVVEYPDQVRGFNPPPSAGLTGMSKIDGVTYQEIGVWNLSGRILTITMTSDNMTHVYLYISGILNPETMMRVKGSVRESIEVVDVLISAKTGKISDVQCYRVGQLIHLYFMYSSPNSWSNGGAREAYIDLGPLPLGIAKGIGRYSGRSFVANITPQDCKGIISMQNCGDSVVANKNVSFQFTYITDDDTTYGNSSIGSGSTGGSGVSSAAVREIVESYNYLDRTIADGIYQQLPYEDSAIPDDELDAVFYLVGI